MMSPQIRVLSAQPGGCHGKSAIFIGPWAMNGPFSSIFHSKLQPTAGYSNLHPLLWSCRLRLSKFGHDDSLPLYHGNICHSLQQISERSMENPEPTRYHLPTSMIFSARNVPVLSHVWGHQEGIRSESCLTTRSSHSPWLPPFFMVKSHQWHSKKHRNILAGQPASLAFQAKTQRHYPTLEQRIKMWVCFVADNGFRAISGNVWWFFCYPPVM